MQLWMKCTLMQGQNWAMRCRKFLNFASKTNMFYILFGQRLYYIALIFLNPLSLPVRDKNVNKLSWRICEFVEGIEGILEGIEGILPKWEKKEALLTWVHSQYHHISLTIIRYFSLDTELHQFLSLFCASGTVSDKVAFLHYPDCRKAEQLKYIYSEIH